MSEQGGGFASAKTRLDEIVAQVRKKDTSLEASLDLLEEGVRLANQCTELIDRADWDSVEPAPDQPDVDEAGPDTAGSHDGAQDCEEPEDLTALAPQATQQPEDDDAASGD